MFKKPFSFEGRIRRTEYGLSFVFYLAALCVILIGINILSSFYDGALEILPLFMLVLYIPMIWFMWAQGAKRCHDTGTSGWYQLIPFYVFYLLFAEGQKGGNGYGEDPKNPAQDISW